MVFQNCSLGEIKCRCLWRTRWRGAGVTQSLAGRPALAPRPAGSYLAAHLVEVGDVAWREPLDHDGHAPAETELLVPGPGRPEGPTQPQTTAEPGGGDTDSPTCGQSTPFEGPGGRLGPTRASARWATQALVFGCFSPVRSAWTTGNVGKMTRFTRKNKAPSEMMGEGQWGEGHMEYFEQ